MHDRNSIYGKLLALLARDPRCLLAALATASELSVPQLTSLLEELRHCGVDLEVTANGDEVVWHDPPELLTPDDLQAQLGEHSRKCITALSIDTTCASTNERVRDLGLPAHGQYHVALAEYQSAGRGRRGREWRAPLAGGICMTVALRYPADRSIDSALTLAMGIAVCEALTPLVSADVLLKWPNDVLIDGRKLGGILTELIGGGGDAAVVLVGIGINFQLPARYPLHLQPEALVPAELAAHLHTPATRALIAARVLDQIVAAAEAYWAGGFTPLQRQWDARDYLREQTVRVIRGDDIMQGVAKGVNAEGALIVDVAGTRHYLNSGEVSVRAN